VPDERLPEAFGEFRRVLAPGGYALLGFQVGHETLHVTQAMGRAISLKSHRRQPERVADLLERAGLNVRARLLREPDEEGDFPERTQQGFVLARKPADA
jgi:hypothetical protein